MNEIVFLFFIIEVDEVDCVQYEVFLDVQVEWRVSCKTW